MYIFFHHFESALHLKMFSCVVGPDSPTTVIKDVTHHTRVMKLKQQSLEDRLKLCLLELKKLCIREAVSHHLRILTNTQTQICCS